MIAPVKDVYKRQSLMYRQEIREKLGDPMEPIPADYVMMTLINIKNPGLLALPTHRLIHGLPAVSYTHLDVYKRQGLIDVLACLIKGGSIASNGRLQKDDHLLSSRIQEEGKSHYFVLSHDPQIIVTQEDISQLQLAKACLLYTSSWRGSYTLHYAFFWKTKFPNW